MSQLIEFTQQPLIAQFFDNLFGVGAGLVVLAGAFFVAAGIMFSRFYRKVGPEEAIVRSGKGGLHAVSGDGIWIIPILHRAEMMDLSVKRIEIKRQGSSGLICKDNVRADIEVAFFVRVNNKKEDILQVAQSLGCAPRLGKAGPRRTVRRQVLRSPQDGRQAVQFRRTV